MDFKSMKQLYFNIKALVNSYEEGMQCTTFVDCIKRGRYNLSTDNAKAVFDICFALIKKGTDSRSQVTDLKQCIFALDICGEYIRAYEAVDVKIVELIKKHSNSETLHN
jgi:predicted ATPase